MMGVNSLLTTYEKKNSAKQGNRFLYKDSLNQKERKTTEGSISKEKQNIVYTIFSIVKKE